MSFEVIHVAPAQIPQSSVVPASARDDYVSAKNAAVEYLKTLGSQASKNAICCRLDQIARWFHYPDAEHCHWALIRYEHVIDFMDHLKNTCGKSGNHQSNPNSLKVSTINSYLYAIKAISRVAWSLGQMGDHDLTRIVSIKPVRGQDVVKGRAMSFTESRVLLSVCDEETPKQIRDRAILSLLLGNGLRRAEITSIQMTDIDLNKNEITIKGKGNKERLIILTDEVFDAVKHWMDVRSELPAVEKYLSDKITQDGDYLFCRFTRHCRALVKGKQMTPRSVWEIANGYIDKASTKIPSIQDISCHDFRRTFATRLFDNGVDIIVVRNLMGHSNIATTARYDKRGDDAMRQAMKSMKL